MPAEAIIFFVLAGIVLFIIVAPPVYIISRIIKSRLEGRAVRGKVIALGVYAISLVMFIAVVIPNFLKFESHSTCSEAKTNLGAIFTTQVSYFAEISSNPNQFTLVNWPAEGDTIHPTCGDGSGLDLNCFIENSPYTVPPPRPNR